MSKLDPQAKREAVDRFRTTLRAGQKERGAIAEAINAYRQAECKPFKDAPRDVGVEIEGYHSGDKCWVTLAYDVAGWVDKFTEDVLYSLDYAKVLFTFYRIPFNPEEG